MNSLKFDIKDVMKQASYFEKLPENRVQCRLCPQKCIINPDKHGICLTRVNHDGTLMSENYGQVVSLAMDPIEKKPLYHFYPGSQILSTGPNGCNIKCQHCQNCEISQKLVRTQPVSPQELVAMAREQDSIGIAYTYTEPFIWFEYLMDTAPLAHEKGLKNVLVTNGFVNQEPLLEILPYIDAMNIDIKSMDPEFYKKICKGKLEPVLRTSEASKKQCLVEITNLLITDLNDSDEWIAKLVNYVKENLGDDTPVHFSRYFPRNKMTRPSTPLERLVAAYKIARQKLKYVYVGNVLLDQGNNTHCPKCGVALVERSGYTTTVRDLKDSVCTKCGAGQNIVM